MKNSAKFIVILGIALTLTASNVYAQRKTNRIQQRNKDVKTGVVMQDLIPATAKLVIVDSIVTNKNDFMQHIPLSKACGKIMRYNDVFKDDKHHNDSKLIYINDFGDRCFFNDSTANGESLLFTAEKLGGKWQKPRALTELGADFQDADFPYLMPDGVTLYFSAKNKEKALGGRDIFMTRLNTDSMTFYKPENVGLPYNSNADEFCCIIDDINNLGWFVTNRRQPSGKVCIYTFVPTTKRWTDDNDEMSEKKLEGFAAITKIADTWTDKTEVNEAKNRLKSLLEKNSSNDIAGSTNDSRLFFPVNDKIVYTSIDDFKSETGKKLFLEVKELKKEKENVLGQLGNLRVSYSNGNNAEKAKLSKTIIKLENYSENISSKIKIIEKKIRNAENLM